MKPGSTLAPPQEVAAPLRRLATAWPARERFWELLLLALYRGGNAAGALAAYADGPHCPAG